MRVPPSPPIAHLPRSRVTSQVAGYAPSDRQLVQCPPSYDDDVLCRSLTLRDRHNNALEVRVSYEPSDGGVHTLALHAAYWVVNLTGLPLAIRELGAAHGFSGDEAAVVREVVCENQRRANPLSSFAPDAQLPFADVRLQKRYTNLAAVWLPPGWVWLDDAWDVERTREMDEAGWRYAGSLAGGWEREAGLFNLVRQRRWFRHRAIAARMDAPTAARLSDPKGKVPDKGGKAAVEACAALLGAAAEGDLAGVTKALQAGAAANCRAEGGETPLLLACANGHHALLAPLLHAGARLRVRSRTGASPLHAAIGARSLPVLRQQHVALVVQTKSIVASCRLDLGELPPIGADTTTPSSGHAAAPPKAEMYFELPLMRNGLTVGCATGLLVVSPAAPSPTIHETCGGASSSPYGAGGFSARVRFSSEVR